MEAHYKEMLERLGISDLISVKGDFRSELSHSIIKAIFYSETDADAKSISPIDLFLSGAIREKDGKIPDYIAILNSSNVLDMLVDLNDKEVTTSDVLAVRKRLLDGIYGNGKYKEGLRRYRLSNGPHIVTPVSTVEKDLNEIISLLNLKHDSPIDAFASSTEFFLRLVDLHPFEDGNGRLDRLFTSFYLLKHGLQPIHVTKEGQKFWPESDHLYFLARYTGAFEISTLLMMLGKDGFNELGERALKFKTSDPLMIEVRDNILLHAGMISEADLQKDIRYLFDEGMKKNGNKSLAYAAMWFSISARIDENDVLLRAFKSNDDPGMRELSIYAMSKINFERYKPIIQFSAYNDSIPAVRMQAFMQLGEHGVITPQMAQKALLKESDETVLIALVKSMTYTKSSEGMADIIKTLHDTFDSKSNELKLRAYQLEMVHGSKERILEVLKKELQNQPAVIKKEIVVELSRFGKLNDPEIAGNLSKHAFHDSDVRKPLFGELLMKDKISESYFPMLKYVIRSRELNEASKAYATYLLGREVGLDVIMRDFGLVPDKQNAIIDNMVLSMVHIADFERGRIDRLDMKLLLNSSDPKLNFVQAIDVGRMIRENSYDERVISSLQELSKKSRYVDMQMMRRGLSDKITNGGIYGNMLSRFSQFCEDKIKEISTSGVNIASVLRRSNPTPNKVRT